MKRWYDGFTFGSVTGMYNPWSIINFIGKNGQYDTYWADSSSNGLVSQLLQTGSINIKQTMELLMQGNSFETEIDEQVIFDQLETDENAVWSLLLATGYLKAEQLKRRGGCLKRYIHCGLQIWKSKVCSLK